MISEIEYLKPFKALMISWKGERPLRVEVQVLHKQWSPWVLYADWGRHRQRGSDADEIVDIDCVRAANGARVRFSGDVEKVWLSTPAQGELPAEAGACTIETGPVWSQMEQIHARPNALCSPTSICHALGAMGVVVEPVEMADRVYDWHHNIHGHWAFAVAAAGEFVDGACAKWLKGLGDLQGELMRGKPVVVSVCGKIIGAPKVYSEGHLMTVVGMGENTVSVLDSAFDTSLKVLVHYSKQDFLSAWRRRHFLAYTFI